MNTIRKIHTDLEENWGVLCSKDWKCAAQQRFARVWCAPMLADIDGLDSATDTLAELCRESMAVAKSVREPDENDQ